MSIKFRVWNKIKKNWYDYEDVFIDQDGEVYLIEERTVSYQTYMHKENITDKVSVVRCAGLKDVNGKGIYEGDILSAVKFGTNIPAGNNLWEIYYNKERFAYYCINQEGHEKPLWELFIGSVRYIVIGNIYENPELLWR